MFIEININDLEKVKNVCSNNDIEVLGVYDNSYWATCKEEILQSVDCSDLLENQTFYDIAKDKADDIIYDLTDELYNAKETNNVFQELAEVAMLITNRKINDLIKNKEK